MWFFGKKRMDEKQLSDVEEEDDDSGGNTASGGGLGKTSEFFSPKK